MSQSPRNPVNWDEYQYGASFRSSASSNGGRSIRFDSADPVTAARDHDVSAHQGERRENEFPDLRRRRSSITMRLNALAQVGGVNSIENFARSWQRAAGFYEVTPRRPSFVLTTDNEVTEGDEEQAARFSRADIAQSPNARTSLLSAHFGELSSPQANNAQVVDEEAVVEDALSPHLGVASDTRNHRSDSELTTGKDSVRGGPSIFAIAPHLATPLAGSYGTSYGTLRSTLNESSMVHAAQLWQDQQASGTTQPDGERPLMLVKEVEQDGKTVLMVAGQSTLPQTIFNSTNVLIGVGILSLPLGLKYSGWVCGSLFLVLAAFVTAYTARILAKCMDVDNSLITFADLAYISYGQRARIATSILFTLELLAACVALIVLFADTLDLLIPDVGIVEWKILCGLLLLPLNFAPLRILSFTSVVGIFSCFCIVLIVFVDGFIKPDSPGSLRQPAETFLFPANWLTLPLSFGLLMSPWGGHGVFPNIYRDMRHPHKYSKAVYTTFSFTYLLDAATAVAGLLMFGEGVLDELTSNIIGTSGYPQALNIMLSIFIAIIPLTKLPLNARPIVSTIEILCGIDTRAVSDSPSLVGLSGFTRGILKFSIRVIIAVVFVVVAILFPAFDSIMAFMGSALCFTICIILPLLFHLKIFGKNIHISERILDWVLIIVCTILASVGTVVAFLPRELLGAT